MDDWGFPMKSEKVKSRIRVKTTIFQNNDQINSITEVFPTKMERVDQQLKIQYTEPESLAKIELEIQKSDEMPKIRIKRSAEFISIMRFSPGMTTVGEYRLSQTQKILFDIRTTKLWIKEDWTQMEWDYQMRQQGDLIGQGNIKIEFV